MEADHDGIRAAVRGFITDRFYVPDPARLPDDVSLLETGVVDSTGVLEIIGFIEAEYQIRVENREILPENLDSIDRVTAFVARKIAAAA